MADLAIACDEVIESYDKGIISYESYGKIIPTNFNEKKAIRNTQNFYILLAFSLITKTLLTASSIHCYLKKY